MAEYCKSCAEKIGLDYDGLSGNEVCEKCNQNGYALTTRDKIIIAVVVIAIILSFGF